MKTNTILPKLFNINRLNKIIIILFLTKLKLKKAILYILTEIRAVTSFLKRKIFKQ